MLSTLMKFFGDIAQDIYSFIIAVAIFKLFYWWTHRKQANAPRPLVKKHEPVSSSASETDRTTRSRTSNGSRSRTTTDNSSNRVARRNWASSGSESSDALRKIYTGMGGLNPKAAVFVPGAEIPEKSQKVQESIQRFKDVLEDWETKQKDLEVDALGHLQDAIAGLAPQDAAMVQALLDSKAAEGDGSQRHASKPFRPYNERTTEYDRAWTRDRASGGGRRGPGDRAAREAAIQEVEGAGDSLRANLLELAAMDSARVIMVRKINQIGLHSASVLEAHYSKFGTIERVMVSHCMAKNTSGIKRLRPAALGFLVMSKAEDAQAILAQGEVQSVQGVNITVGKFESHPV